MTEENYKYRTNQIMLRNQFPGNGVWNIPIIPKFQERPGDFDDLLLIGFDKTDADDRKHPDRMVHFSSTIIVLSVYGKSRILYLTDYIHIVRCLPRISVCIWK